MNNIISPEVYANLSEDEAFYYDPEYHKYKVTKIRNYENCDLGHTHFMGWVEQRTPIGEPYRYIRDNSLTRYTMKLMQPAILDGILDGINKSNILAARMMKKWSDE